MLLQTNNKILSKFSTLQLQNTREKLIIKDSNAFYKFDIAITTETLFILARIYLNTQEKFG